MSVRPADARLYHFEKVGLALFALLVLSYGVMTEIRSCFLKFRHTDFGMLARAGWAVRTGDDIYRVTDDGGLHYTYPSAFSVVMTPLADPPAGADRAGYLPYAVSVAVFYLLSVGFVAWAVHALARAVLPDAVRGSRRWWYARTVPVYVCLGGIGFSLGRGQVTLLLVALIAVAFLAAVRGRRVVSGAWLGAAAVIKVLPAFLLLFPFVRRDWRAGVGVAAAAVVGLGVLPAAVWGVDGALAQHAFFVRNVLQAGATGSGGEQRFAHELTKTTATDSQSFQAAIHHVLYLDREKADRPAHASANTRLAHWGISGVLTAITLLVARRRLGPTPADQLVFLGCLCGLMMVVTPVSHMHYYALVLPLVAGLWLRSLADRPEAVWADARTTTALAVWGIMTALPLFPGPVFVIIRECGFGAAATVGLWAFGLWTLGRPAGIAVGGDPIPFPTRTTNATRRAA